MKYLVKTFTLPDVQVGSIIEYFYTIDLSEHYIYESHWILSDELFTKKAVFSLKPFKSNYLPVYLHWTWQGLPPGSEVKQGADGIMRMEATNIPAFQTEDFMPPANEVKSRVDFIYSENSVEKDPNAFWEKGGQKTQRPIGKLYRKTQCPRGCRCPDRLSEQHRRSSPSATETARTRRHSPQRC
jgi:hypothetical protein